MSTLHHVCTACFFEERRGFTFIGSVPAGHGLDCPVCGAPTHRLLRFGANELGPRAELVRHGDLILVREPRWESLRHTILGVLEALWRFDVVRRPDDLIELPIRDKLALVVRPVHDQITGQEGCLLACPLMSLAEPVDAAEVRSVLASLNEALGEQVLLLGTMRDLFTLADARPTIFYRLFLSRAALIDVEAFAAVIERARRQALLVHQALLTLGTRPEAATFLERVASHLPAAPVIDESWDDAAADLIARRSAVALDELLTAADTLRGPRSTRDEVRTLVFEDFLHGLGLDLEAARDPGDPDRLLFHHDGLHFTLTFERDERDSYLRLSTTLAWLTEPDAPTAARLLAVDTVPHAAELQLVRDGDRLRLELRETLLGDDLDLGDLARTLAETAACAASLHASLQELAVPPAPPRGAPLAPLIEAAAGRGPLPPGIVREDALERRVQDFLQRLGLRPALAVTGDIQLTLDDHLDVWLRIVATEHTTELLVRTRVVERVEVTALELVQAIADAEPRPRLGAFAVSERQELYYEDRVPADGLDLNEVVRTIHAVATVARDLGPALRKRLEAATPAADDGEPPRWLRTVRTLVEQYRRGPAAAARARIVRALSMFDDAAAHRVLLEALQDPSPEVSTVAVAGLVATLAVQPPGALEQLCQIAGNGWLGDAVRGRAVRVVGALRGRRGREPAIEVLRRIASDGTESHALRVRALEALAALGPEKAVVDALIANVQDRSYRVAHTALQALGRLDVPDSARLFLAAQAAVDGLEGRDVEQRGEVFSTLSGLGMQETVLDLAAAPADALAPELAAALAQAAATHRPPEERVLAALLAQPRGSVRAAALEAIARARLSGLAEAVAEALERESDLELAAAGVAVLLELGVRSARVERVLAQLASEPRLRG